MTSPPEDVWDVIRRDLAIRLKTAGFTRKGRRFRRLRGASVACVDVQTSRFGGGDFTIEVGVYFPEVVRLLDEAPLAEFPALEDCLLSHRERLPFLGPDGRDRWWIVPPRNSDLVVPPGYLGGSQPGTREALARYIADLWTTHGVPWLEWISDPRNARTVLSDDERLPRAALSVVVGDLLLAAAEIHEDYLAAQVRDAPATVKRIRAFARRAGLDNVVGAG